MEDFYFYAMIVALIILILILTMVGITISYGNSLKRFPLNASQCPDYWTASGDYCRFPGTGETNRGNSDFLGSGAAGPYPSDPELLILGNLGSVGYSAANGSGTSYTGANLTSSNLNTAGSLFVRMNNNDASWNSIYTGITPRCAKRKWALESGIVWDGITNYNGCS
jgi:hypothetical protein